MLVQFPFELKDVLVSDPEKVDAVVQSSNRVFLIAKKAGPDQRLLLRHQGTADPDRWRSRSAPTSRASTHPEALRARLQHPRGDGGQRRRPDRARCARRWTPSARPISPASSSPPTSASATPAVAAEPTRPMSASTTTEPAARRIRAADPDAGRGLRQRHQARHQPAHRRGRGAGDAQGHRRRGAALYPQAVRHQPRRRHQLRQLRDRAAHRERAAAHGRRRSWQVADPGDRHAGTGSHHRARLSRPRACSAAGIRDPAPAPTATRA